MVSAGQHPETAVGEAWVERQIYVMGTQLRGIVEAPDKATGAEILEQAFDAVRGVDALLSTWRDDTELARVNRSAPRVPAPITTRLLALLSEVQSWRGATGGAFDPAVGPLIDVWDLRGRGRRPSEKELARALAESGPDAFRVDRRGGTVVRAYGGSWLDSGGFGKGAALRDVRELLGAQGVRRALFDFGGQLLAVGAPEAADGWVVAVAHPFRRDEAVAELRLRDASVATTSASERFVEVEGERFGHVLDPRTGRPVAPWGSVTAVTKDPLTADVLSTALFVLGPEEGAAWAAEREDVGVLFLVARGTELEARWNRAMERWLVRVPGARAGEAAAPSAAPTRPKAGR